MPDDAWQPRERGRAIPTGFDETPTGAPGPEPSDPELDDAFYSTTVARYGSWRTVVGMILLAVVAANVFAVIVTLPSLASEDAVDPLANSYTLPLLVLLQGVVWVGAVYLLLIRRGGSTWERMGFRSGGPGNAFLVGTGYGLLFIVVAAVVGVAQSALFGLEQQEALPYDLNDMSTAGKVAAAAGIALVAPFAEEIFFRGYVFRAMAARKGLLRGVIYSSFLFGAIHLIRDWPPDLSPLLPIAIGSTLLAVAYHRSRNIWTPIVAHTVNNAFAVSFLFLGG